MPTEYAIYLRKSRLDIDAEAHGEGDTLARHERALIGLAQASSLSIGEVYREIRSGDSIADRPEMQRLMADVQSRAWAGVLVMDIDRLARGDTVDQGHVAQVFKYSNTKIITPLKTYDPNNEYDEEFFEFSLFMARREYKMITRRMQRGRLASVREGNFIAGQCPYGYARITDEQGPTLAVNPEEAKHVKYIFDAYTESNISAYSIARKLNGAGIPSCTGKMFSQETIRDILRNPTYAGYIRWRNRVQVKDPADPQKRRKGNADEYICVPGRHEAIISQTQFDKSIDIMKSRSRLPIRPNHEIKNPLAGIVVCGECGRRYVRRKRGNGSYGLCCAMDAQGCSNRGLPLKTAEEMILSTLREWFDAYNIAPTVAEVPEAPAPDIAGIKKEIATLHQQRDSLYDLLEQGVYDKDIFIQRSHTIALKINDAQKMLSAAEAEAKIMRKQKAERESLIPKIENILIRYPTASVQEKNDLLRGVVEKAVVTRYQDKPISLNVFPKLPN